MNSDIIKMLRESVPKKIAAEIIDVQPMPADCFAKMYEAAWSEDRLREEGFEPVSSLGLLWVKKKVDETPGI